MNYLATTLFVLGVTPLIAGVVSGVEGVVPPGPTTQIREIRSAVAPFPPSLERPAAALDSPPLPPLKTIIQKVLEQAPREEQKECGLQPSHGYQTTKATRERDAEG